MCVLSDDFATVDLREDYANLSLPKEQIQEITITAKPMKRKDRTAEKAAADPERFSGDGSAPPRLSVWFSALFLLPFRGVCLAAAPKHTPWCQTVKISEFIIVLPIIFLDRISSI